MLRDPSAPTRQSQRTSCAVPSASREQDARAGRTGLDDRGVADAEADVTAVAVPGVGQVDEHVGLRVEPHRGRRSGPRSRSGGCPPPKRRSMPRCSSPSRSTRSDTPARPAAGRCRARGCRPGRSLDLVRLRWSTTTESMPARPAGADSISPAGPPPTMPTVVVLRWTVGCDIGSFWAHPGSARRAGTPQVGLRRNKGGRRGTVGACRRFTRPRAAPTGCCASPTPGTSG